MIDGIDYWAEAIAVVMGQETAARADSRGRPLPSPAGWFLDVEAVVSTEPASLWSLLWEHEYTSARFTYAPRSNPIPTESEPHFTGTLYTGAAPSIGGEAGATVEHTFAVRLVLDGKPRKITDPADLPGAGDDGR